MQHSIVLSTCYNIFECIPTVDINIEITCIHFEENGKLVSKAKRVNINIFK